MVLLGSPPPWVREITPSGLEFCRSLVKLTVSQRQLLTQPLITFRG